MATVRLRNEHSQLDRNPASSCCDFGSGETERRTPKAERFAYVIVTTLMAKLMAINAANPSSA